MLTLFLALSAHAGGAPDWNALFDEAGWNQVATPSTKDTGTIDLRLKDIHGSPCLRGEARVQVPPEKVIEVARDIANSPKYSSETLLAAEELAHDGATMDYYQHLDVPNWTMASDRFWVLRGTETHDEHGAGFRWNQFDWRAKYPELAQRIDANHADAIEPDTNWGTWTAQAVEGGTVVRYYICSNAGGSLPEWLQKAAATKTLPGTMGDIIREAARRSK